MVLNVKNKINYYVTNIGFIIWAFFLYQLSSIPFILATTGRIVKSEWEKNVAIVVGIILSILLIRYLWKEFDGDFQPEITFMKDWKKSQKVWIYLILLILLIGGGYLAGFLPSSNNQAGIEEMFQGNKWSTIIPVVVFGPIIEELIFRGLLQKLFFKRITTKLQLLLYLIISIVLFVGIHGPAMNLEMVSYILMGVVFSLAYVLLGDIKYNISLHIINNAIGILSLFLLN